MADGFSAKLDFTGRVALVTGGASGIGFAVASQLGELGARVTIADLDIDGANTAARRLSASGVDAMAVNVEVRDPDETAFTAVFLASEQARYVTGHILGVDGGFLAAGVMHRKDNQSR